MELRSLADAEPFTTKDGSTIRELHHTRAQSLAEARLEPGQATQRHYHARAEEIYLVTEGRGVLEVDGVVRDVREGDAVLIPPGARHELIAGRRACGSCACARRRMRTTTRSSPDPPGQAQIFRRGLVEPHAPRPRDE